MEFVEHLYTNDTTQISNIDKINSGVENVTLFIYENKVDYGRILTDFNIIKDNGTGRKYGFESSF
jgi:hypothetical protein